MTPWTAVNSEGYPAPAALAVDTVVLTVREGRLSALALRGGGGALALPGGLVGQDERPADTARRKLLEKTGLRRGYLEQLGASACGLKLITVGRDDASPIAGFAALAVSRRPLRRFPPRAADRRRGSASRGSGKCNR